MEGNAHCSIHQAYIFKLPGQMLHRWISCLNARKHGQVDIMLEGIKTLSMDIMQDGTKTWSNCRHARWNQEARHGQMGRLYQMDTMLEITKAWSNGHHVWLNLDVDLDTWTSGHHV